MKYFLTIASLTFFLLIAVPKAHAQYICEQGSDAIGWCGERGGCAEGLMCVGGQTTACLPPSQADAANRCINSDEGSGVYCGALLTNNKCGPAGGGCLKGYKCEVTHVLGYMTGSKCVLDEQSCGAAAPTVSKCSTTSGCGYCDDPQEYCTVVSGAETCSKIVGQCNYVAPATPEKCGTEVYENNKYVCKVDGVAVSGFSDCAFLPGKCCPSLDMCKDSSGVAPGCGQMQTSAANATQKVCNVNGTIISSGYNDCSSNPSTPNGCCYGTSCPALSTLSCGQQTNVATQQCGCATGLKEYVAGTGSFCCGYIANAGCYPTQAAADAAKSAAGNVTQPSQESAFSIFDGPTSESFKKLNPLAAGGMFNVDTQTATELSSPGGIITRLLRFAFPVAGLLLFVMLIWAGFEILYRAPSGKSIQQGSQRATAAIIGFVLLFASYFIMQLIEVVFGIKVL